MPVFETSRDVKAVFLFLISASARASAPISLSWQPAKLNNWTLESCSIQEERAETNNNRRTTEEQQKNNRRTTEEKTTTASIQYRR